MNDSFQSALQALRHQFPNIGNARQAPPSPQMKRMQAIMEAQQRAAQNTQSIQYKRRFNGPYS